MTVSILIPAFRPTFLRQTIASALTQGLEDFEIIISDDSGGEELLPIVEQFRDPRIRYVRTAGRVGGAENCRGLWDLATRDRLLFLFDDDLLAPHAVPEMGAQLDAHPYASFCFAQRYMIDHTGRIIMDPPTPRESPIVVDHPKMVRSLVGQVKNVIGEFSNIIINRAVGLTIEDMLYYRGFEMKVMADVGFFVNATRTAPAVGISVPVGAFRRHEAQNSSAEFNPKLYLLLGEWAIMLRGEYQAGSLTHEEALKSAAILKHAYAKWGDEVPGLRTLVPGHDELIQQIERQDRNVLTDAFRADLDHFLTHYEDGAAPASTAG